MACFGTLQMVRSFSKVRNFRIEIINNYVQILLVYLECTHLGFLAALLVNAKCAAAVVDFRNAE